MVDSVSKVYLLLKELRKCQGNDEEQTGGFEYWEFLSKWERLTLNEKNKKYDEFVCDELNLFIFFKDRAFFETNVRGYLANKFEQTFIDYFLLSNEEKLAQYTSPDWLQQLNSLEQALLVIYFAEVKKVKEIAADIAARMENENKLRQVDIKEYKRLFDTVLGA